MPRATPHALPLPALLAALAAGCGSTPATDTPADPNAIHLDFSTTVAPGAEVQLCRLWALPTDRGPIAVRASDHTYTAGSHHFLVYRTTEKTVPPGGDVLRPCDETDWMSKVRGVTYGAQDPTGSQVLPDGVAQRFEPGDVLLVQSHYVNASPGPLDASIHLTLHTTPPETVKTEAGFLFFFNPIIDVPPMGSSTATMRCPIPEDIHMVFASSHMHQRGVDFEAHVEGAANGSLYKTQSWNEPVPRGFLPTDAGGTIAKGSTIAYTCAFQNHDQRRYLAGPSATENEMCMLIGMYWPRLDQTTEFCWQGAVASKGTASCLQTMQCAGACRADDVECHATCMDAICPTAAGPLMRVGRCVQSLCAEACAAGAMGSSECTKCATMKCPDELTNCLAASCPRP